jgi:hypothetical protein
MRLTTITPGRFGEPALPQFEIAAIERHHPINIRNPELLDHRAVILPDIDRFFAILCYGRTNHLWLLAHSEKRQTVGRSEKTIFIIKSHGKNNDRTFIVRKRVWHELYPDRSGSVEIGCSRRGFSEFIHLQVTDQITMRVVLSGR